LVEEVTNDPRHRFPRLGSGNDVRDGEDANSPAPDEARSHKLEKAQDFTSLQRQDQRHRGPQTPMTPNQRPDPAASAELLILEVQDAGAVDRDSSVHTASMVADAPDSHPAGQTALTGPSPADILRGAGETVRPPTQSRMGF
jgi:hypothetical protein